MKRCIVSILALIYLSTANGIVVYVHYCMGELIECSLADKKTESCSMCGMKKENGTSKDCCKDEQKQVKLGEHNRAGNPHCQVAKPIVNTIQSADCGLSTLTTFTVTQNNAPGKPPSLTRAGIIYLRNCVFRI